MHQRRSITECTSTFWTRMRLFSTWFKVYEMTSHSKPRNFIHVKVQEAYTGFLKYFTSDSEKWSPERKELLKFLGYTIDWKAALPTLEQAWCKPALISRLYSTTQQLKQSTSSLGCASALAPLQSQPAEHRQRSWCSLTLLRSTYKGSKLLHRQTSQRTVL